MLAGSPELTEPGSDTSMISFLGPTLLDPLDRHAERAGDLSPGRGRSASRRHGIHLGLVEQPPNEPNVLEGSQRVLLPGLVTRRRSRIGLMPTVQPLPCPPAVLPSASSHRGSVILERGAVNHFKPRARRLLGIPVEAAV